LGPPPKSRAFRAFLRFHARRCPAGRLFRFLDFVGREERIADFVSEMKLESLPVERD
jgi:hypothetical protein